MESGLREVLAQYPHIRVRTLYMDGKRSMRADHMNRSAVAVREVIDSFAPHVLVLVDDAAQQYVGRNYTHKPGMQVVFAGVNADLQKYGYESVDAQVTGVLERLPLSQIHKSLPFFHKEADVPELYIIGDRSNPVSFDIAMMKKFAVSYTHLTLPTIYSV